MGFLVTKIYQLSLLLGAIVVSTNVSEEYLGSGPEVAFVMLACYLLGVSAGEENGS